ncbi:malate dehydrogenase [Clostridium pasteurianum]|nr:malate dehydrogenase [Clostridium pasteurianum]
MHTKLKGRELLNNPFLNKGTAFSKEERKKLGLEGLLPIQVETIEKQEKRCYKQFKVKPDNFSKHLFLMDLYDINRTLFYKVVTSHIKEMLPIIYTPTIGTGVKKYCEEFKSPMDSFYLSIDDRENMDKAFDNLSLNEDDIEVMVITDSQGILGIGDWGVNGIDISIGKLAVYTAAAGVDPSKVLPVVLDVGTDNKELLESEFYFGTPHERIQGSKYYDFIDQFVKTALKKFPKVLIHWEDFGRENAHKVLEKYKDNILTFNDDIQGTGAMIVSAVMSMSKASDTPLKEQRIVIFGAGTAGIGIANQISAAMEREGLSKEEARNRFWCIDRYGLLIEDMNTVIDFQKPYARKRSEFLEFKDKNVELLDVVKIVKPTMLIGCSGVSGAFKEEVIREMAKGVERPAIMPISNPTNLAEAVPKDLIEWTEGRGLVVTGSPFEPVEYKGTTYKIGQANNALLFPGLGFGAMIAKPKYISERLLEASSKAVAEFVDLSEKGAPLLPEVEKLHQVSQAVAVKVIEAALEEEINTVEIKDVKKAVSDATWYPEYKDVLPED